MRVLTSLDLDGVSGGAGAGDDPMGPTELVMGRPQTCRAIMARGDKLFAQGEDKSIPNDVWLLRYKHLNDAFQRLPSLDSCPKPTAK